MNRKLGFVIDSVVLINLPLIRSTGDFIITNKKRMCGAIDFSASSALDDTALPDG